MKCPRCNGEGSVPYHIAGDLFDETNCPLCGGSGEYEPFDADVELDRLDDDIKPKLKPCPFCGGEAMTNKLYENEWYVYCPKCERNYDTEQEAIEAWNKRVVEE